MENASKALLIAGSILIVILLIAVGMRVFNSTSGTTDSVELVMGSTEIAMFNNKFIPHVGKNKSKREAIAVINKVIANNSTSNRKVNVKLWYPSEGYDRHGTEINKLNEMLAKINNTDVDRLNIEISGGYSGSDTVSGYDGQGYITNIFIHNSSYTLTF